MSKTKHTFAKRQREIDKKRKADEKRARRRDKSKGQEPATDGDSSIDQPNTTELESTPAQSLVNDNL